MIIKTTLNLVNKIKLSQTIIIDLVWYNLFLTYANSAIFKVFKSGLTFALVTPYRVGTHSMRPVTDVRVFHTFIDIWNVKSYLFIFLKNGLFSFLFLYDRIQQILENGNEFSFFYHITCTISSVSSEPRFTLAFVTDRISTNSILSMTFVSINIASIYIYKRIDGVFPSDCKFFYEVVTRNNSFLISFILFDDNHKYVENFLHED